MSGGCEKNSVPCRVDAFGASTTTSSLPHARFGFTGEGAGWGERRELAVGKGVLFLLLPAPGEANLRWQRARKLWEVWVAPLVVEVQGKQAVRG